MCFSKYLFFCVALDIKTKKEQQFHKFHKINCNALKMYTLFDIFSFGHTIVMYYLTRQIVIMRQLHSCPFTEPIVSRKFKQCITLHYSEHYIKGKGLNIFIMERCSIM